MNNKLNNSSLDQVTGGTKLKYTLQAGDTLQSVAEKNRCTVADLMKWNPTIIDPNNVNMGQVVELRF